jgi:hypothetical protein
MKKIISVTICFLAVGSFLPAQDFDEWFRQNKTQINYLDQQIAAYAFLLSDLTKGYDTAEAELAFTAGSENKEYELHRNYFNSLHLVSPAVLAYPRAREIIADARALIRHFNSLFQAKNMTAVEMSYFHSVYNNLSSHCNQSLDELTGLLTDNSLSLTDDERIQGIDALYRDMKDKYAFSQSFTSEAMLLAASREGSLEDIRESMLNNGLQ